MRNATALVALAGALIALAGAGCGTKTRACREGTAFLTVSFDSATAAADRFDVTLTVDTRMMTFNRTRAGGGSSETIEINFTPAYPTGKKIFVSVTALSGTTVLGSGSGSVTLDGTCGSLAVSVSGGATGDGGVTLDLMPAPADLLIPNDLTTLPDLTSPPDLASVPDLSVVDDLASPPDFAPPQDFAAPSDFAPPPDFVPPADLKPPPDFAPQPDFTSLPDLRPDFRPPTIDLALPFKRLFVTAAPYSPSGIPAADNMCNVDTERPPMSNPFKAMLVDGITRRASVTANLGDGQVDWVFRPNTNYRRSIDGADVFTTNANGIFIFGMLNNGLTTGNLFWTGIEANWVTSPITCNAWTDTTVAVTGRRGGQGTSLDGLSIAGGTTVCSQALARFLLCVEQ